MNESLSSPKYSYWPIVLAAAVAFIAIGIVWNIVISVFGLVMLLVAIVGWIWENRSAEQEQ
jgi:hypothetical protein